MGGEHYEIWDFSWDDRRRLNPDTSPVEHESMIVLEQKAAGLFSVGSYEVGSASFHVCDRRAVCFTEGQREENRGFGSESISDKVVFDEKGSPARAHINFKERRFVRAEVPFTAGWNEADYYSGIWKVLLDANFGGPVSSDVHLKKIGSVAAGGRSYELWSHDWEETPETKVASTEHAAYHLLVFERRPQGLAYLGNYRVDGVPVTASGRTIKFNYGKEPVGQGLPPARRGDEVVIGDNGFPPRILLAGEFRSFDPASHHAGAWLVLDRGGFSGSTDIDANVTRAGIVSAGGKQYEVWNYSWVEDQRTRHDGVGGRKHEDYRVLVFERKPEGLSYLGGYEGDGAAFHVEGRTVRFDLPKGGKPPEYLNPDPGPGIDFDDNGPPAQARVNWVMRTLKK